MNSGLNYNYGYYPQYQNIQYAPQGSYPYQYQVYGQPAYQADPAYLEYLEEREKLQAR